MPRVIILTTNSQVRIGNPAKLEEFQQIVGGYIETVQVRDGRDGAIMVVNEEGLLKNLVGAKGAPFRIVRVEVREAVQ